MPDLALLQPIVIGPYTLNNRLALAPMTRARSGPDRIPTSLMAQYYRQRASAGLVITEATVVSAQGIGWNESPGIYTDAMTEGWKATTQSVHDAGGRIFLQLWHCGRASHSDFHKGEPPVSASAVKLNGDQIHTPLGKKDYELPRALETDELPGLVEDYRRATERALEAGFDGVEIYAANGYLLNQFLDGRSNQRTDQYGGSVENRFRLLRDVLSAVTSVMPANQVSVRLSPNGMFNDMGWPGFREQFLYAMKELDAFGLGFLHVMDGLAFGFHEQGEPITLAECREVYAGPLMGNCGYDKDLAEAAIASSAADMIAIGRPYLSNPDLVERWANGWPEAPLPDMSAWYTPAGTEGYTDHPAYAVAPA
jgi:2,4-dienoyl-CoA reductase-like NADH-dependent reductase (Old Yellow Enzyme family)